MIKITDGSKADAVFAISEDCAIIREAIVRAVSRGSTLATQFAALAVPKEMEGAVVDAVQAKVTDVMNTALDLAAETLVERFSKKHGGGIQTATVASAAALSAVAGPSEARQALYHAGSLLGDAQALASGDPAKIARRAEQHIFWRFFGRLGRAFSRKL